MNTIESATQGMNDLTAPAKRSKLSLGQQLETVFLTEILKISGVGKLPESFGGGVGEDQFSSFLREAQAKEMVRAGGLGLAQQIDMSLGIEQ